MTSENVRLERRDGVVPMFWELKRDGTTISLGFGRLGADARTKEEEFDDPESARARAEALIAEKLAQGYVEVPLLEVIAPAPIRLSVKEAQARYPVLEFAEVLLQSVDQVTVLLGAATTNGTLRDLHQGAADADKNSALVVDGDLTLTGSNTTWGRRNPRTSEVLLVRGEVFATGLELDGVCEMLVDGHLYAERIFLHDGLEGGALRVAGVISAPWIITIPFFGLNAADVQCDHFVAAEYWGGDTAVEAERLYRQLCDGETPVLPSTPAALQEVPDQEEEAAADQPAAIPELNGRIHPGSPWEVDIEGTRLLREPHQLLLILEEELALRLTDCDCAECQRRAADTLEYPAVTPDELGMFMRHHGVERLRLITHRDLALPGPEGSPAPLRELLQRHFDAIRAAGVALDFVEATSLEVGSWVETTGYAFIALDNIVVPGLLGQVTPDRYGICTPGVSTMIQLVGRESSYGYFDSLHRPRAVPPTDEEIAEAEALAARALEAFEAVHGWTGFLVLRPGSYTRDRDARRELRQLVTKLRDPQHLSEAEGKGLWKRARRILRAYAEQAKIEVARDLLDASSDVAWSALPADFCAAALSFCDADFGESEPDQEPVH